MYQIEFKSVSKHYLSNAPAVEHFTLAIKEKQFVSFLGPSGCGKTTTLRMLAGLEKPSQGQIWIAGQCVSDPEANYFTPPENRNIGMVFQSYAVWPHLTVFQNIAYPLKIQKLSKDEITIRVNQILKVVELTNYSERKPNELSGGQQQRVALARGLVMKPKVLLLDEPLSNLDAKLREKMRTDIRRWQQEMGLTVVYVTHDQIEAFQMSDRIVIMNNGKIEQVGSPDEIKKHPSSDFVRSFIS